MRWKSVYAWPYVSIALALLGLLISVMALVTYPKAQIPQELWIKYPHSVYLYNAGVSNTAQAISDLIEREGRPVVAVYSGRKGYKPVVILQDKVY